MLAASYWSLLAPAIEMAQESGTYGADGEWAFVPVAIGFALGAYFVYLADILLQQMVIVILLAIGILNAVIVIEFNTCNSVVLASIHVH